MITEVSQSSSDRSEILRMATAGVVRAGLSGPYGHLSMRIDAGHFLVTPAKALSTIGAADEGLVVPTVGPLPPKVAGEVRIHQRIYASRPAVGAIIRFISPNVVALSALGDVPRPRHGFGSYFYPQPGFWPSIQLVRSDELADGAVEVMGQNCALIMRGNGAVVAGADIRQAVSLAVYLEDAARVELEALRTGRQEAPTLSAEEAAERATWEGGVADRMWDHLTRSTGVVYR
ncbi:MAG: aldolase [Sphingomonadales bacterium]|nr:aldolase [Sphingomonadales bacterium]